MMVKYANILCLILLYLPLSLFSIAEPVRKPESQTDSCQLTLSVAEWPPYQYFTKNNKAAGVQIDLINRIAKEANCELSIKRMVYYQSLIEVEKGTVDFTLNATVTDERKKFGLFSIPYRNETLVLYVTEQYVSDCKSMTIADLIKKGFRLGLQKRMVYGESISRLQHTPELNKKIRYFDYVGQDLGFLRDNQLDGIIEDPVMIAYKIRKSKTPYGLFSCHVSVSSSPVSLLFSNKTVSPAIVERFNQAIEKVKQTDYYQNHWGW